MYLFNRLNIIAKSRGLSVGFTYEDFLTFTKISKCHYCETKITWYPHSVKRENTTYSYNLDRTDNSEGYTKDNCVVCCKECNNAKNNFFTYDEMIIIGRAIKEVRQKRMEGKLTGVSG